MSGHYYSNAESGWDPQTPKPSGIIVIAKFQYGARTVTFQCWDDESVFTVIDPQGVHSNWMYATLGDTAFQQARERFHEEVEQAVGRTSRSDLQHWFQRGHRE